MEFFIIGREEDMDEQNEDGTDARWAETFKLESSGQEYLEFHIDFIGVKSSATHIAMLEDLDSFY